MCSSDLYIDSDHITRTTSESLSDLFDRSFARLSNPTQASNLTQMSNPTQVGDPAVQVGDTGAVLQSSFSMPGKTPPQ